MKNPFKATEENPLYGWTNILSLAALMGFIAWAIMSNVGKHNSVGSNIIGVLTLVVALTSLILIAVSSPKTNLSKMINGALPLLITLALASYFLEKTLSITWFPEVIVAWGTIILALATFQLGQTTVKENKIQRERESKRRRLDEVQQWIEGASGMRSKYEGLLSDRGFARLDRLEALLVGKTYIVLEAKWLDSELASISNLRNKYKDDRLENLVERLSKAFVEQHNLLFLPNLGNAADGGRIDKEIMDNCKQALSMISDLRAELAL